MHNRGAPNLSPKAREVAFGLLDLTAHLVWQGQDDIQPSCAFAAQYHYRLLDFACLSASRRSHRSIASAHWKASIGHSATSSSPCPYIRATREKRSHIMATLSSGFRGWPARTRSVASQRVSADAKGAFAIQHSPPPVCPSANPIWSLPHR